MHTFTAKSGRLIQLRPPQAGDEKILFEFAKAIEQEDTFILLNPLEPVTWQEECKYLEESLRRLEVGWQVHLLAFHENRMIGSSQVSNQGRRKKHVGNFGISLLPDYRHDGIGTYISNYIIAKAKAELGVSIITLEYFAQNTVARHLYDQLGFCEYGRLPQGLSHRQQFDDAVLMYRQV
jgi:RimJ/RimL family protein N-acetyltransferase